MDIQTKICSICNKDKDINEFYSYKKNRSNGEQYIYYQPYCKACSISKSHEWNYNNYSKLRENYKNYYKNNEDAQLGRKESSRKRREAGKHAEWQRNNKDKLKQYKEKRIQNKSHTISGEEWEECLEYFNHSCAYCRIKQEDAVYRYKQKLHKDHVENNGSNKVNNCVPACKSCNSRKWAYDMEDWYKNQIFFNSNSLSLIKEWVNLKSK